MANSLFEKGREGFLDGSLDWDTQAFAAALIDLGTTDVGIKTITSSTNATPIVVTATAHGFANGDIVYIDGITTGTSGNGVWKIANQAANTFELTDPVTGSNAVGNGVGAGGVAVCLGPSAAGDMWDDFNAALVGSPFTPLVSKTVTQGVADAGDATFTAVTGATVEAVVIYQDTGTPSTSRMVALITGKHIVTCSKTLTAGTSLDVDPLVAGIPNTSVLAFSTGQSATLNDASALTGERIVTVNSTTITAAGRALAPATGSGLPVTPNGGNIIVAWDNGVNKIFKL